MPPLGSLGGLPAAHLAPDSRQRISARPDRTSASLCADPVSGLRPAVVGLIIWPRIADRRQRSLRTCSSQSVIGPTIVRGTSSLPTIRLLTRVAISARCGHRSASYCKRVIAGWSRPRSSKKAAMSRLSKSGSSAAGKWPPLGMGVHRRMLYRRSAHSRGGVPASMNW
jgi:hypothetical protein